MADSPPMLGSGSVGNGGGVDHPTQPAQQPSSPPSPPPIPNPVDRIDRRPDPIKEVGVLTSGGRNTAQADPAAALPPHAGTPAPVAIELQTTRTEDSKKLVGTINIGDKRKTLTTEDFRKVILDASHYPLSATFRFFKTLEASKLIGRQGDFYIVYQRTGGALGVSSRQYVIAMRVKEETADRVEIEWYLVKMQRDKQGNFTGPYSADLNKNREDAEPDNSEDAVYTPYNHGGWIYDRKAGKITYHLDSDTGGSLPGWMVSKGALLAFPQELLKVKWKIEGEIEGSLD